MTIDIPAIKVICETLKAYRDGFTLIANVGGTRSGKTYSIMETLLLVAFTERVDIDIVSESLPHLKKGALKDFQDIVGSFGLRLGFHYNENKTDRTFTICKTASVIRFFSADDWGKVKGSRRDILFINECNRIDFETYRQLAVRTSRVKMLDWNPDSEFWFEEKGLDREPTTKVIRSTYTDNPFLGAVQIAEIERYKSDENWWRVYGMGLTGTHQGIIYKRVRVIDELPDTRGMLHYYGLDFGFTNDPTALVDVYIDTRGMVIYCDELIYETGLLNRDIASRLASLHISKTTEIFADAAEPKSIDELGRRVYGYNVKPAYKQDLNSQIQYVQGFEIRPTKKSLNLIRELRNYKWKTDRDGNSVNEPAGIWDHNLDALRYAVFTPLRGIPRLGGGTIRTHYERFD